VIGRCLCGRVMVEIPAKPEYINFCNCRLCRAAGAAWAYFDAVEVTVAGATVCYGREDLADTWLQIHFCPTCGSTTHYDATAAHPSTRLGVNTRLFTQDDLEAIPVKYQDGRRVETEDDCFATTGTGHIGDGKAVLTRKAAFAPAAAPDARVLILGSLPGEASLAARQYYAHPRNLFWHLVGHAIGRDLASLDYDSRLAALRSARIALWDTVASARRSGSLDAAIREAELAPLARLVDGLPHLRAIAFNGRKASAIGRPQLAHADRVLIDLPSSSPAYAAMPLTDKERLWARLADFLG
jgi:double-stranded uracil-DNA glycosylase